MTTAIQTKFNVLAMAPVIDIRKNDSRLTAETFVNNNIRHIVTRRMKWTTTEDFVLASLRALQFATSGVITGDSVTRAIEYAMDTIRDAVNRRRTWSAVRDLLVSDVEDIILAAQRLL